MGEATQPDAIVYLTEAGERNALCVLCLDCRTMPTGNVHYATLSARRHLRTQHGKHHARVDVIDREWSAAVDAALDIVIANNTTRHA